MDIIIRLIFAIIWVATVYRWGDWRNWRKYYPTILFFIFGNFIYLIIFYKKLLWRLESEYIGFPFIDFYMTFIIFTCTILIFLPHYPKTKSIWKHIVYNLLWVFLYTTIEFIFSNLGLISYHNGWRLLYSMIHNSYQFPILKIHHHRPIIAWIFAFIIVVIFVNIFDIPFLI